MENNNIREYEILRSEMLSVKECITNYIGFMLGGSGIASISVIGIVGVGSKNIGGIINLENMLSLFSMLSLFISLLISFVLLIIFYKFTSHNRFAGYCKLIGTERHIENNNHTTSIIGWEAVLETQREYSNDVTSYIALVDELDNDADKIKLRILLAELLNDQSTLVNGKLFDGLSFIFKSIFVNFKSRSWAFPPYVVSMFFFITTWFYAIGIIIFVSIHRLAIASSMLYFRSFELFIFISISIAQIMLWRKYFYKLNTLMSGSKSVNSFYVLLIPARVKHLRLWGIKPKYEL